LLDDAKRRKVRGDAGGNCGLGFVDAEYDSLAESHWRGRSVGSGFVEINPNSNSGAADPLRTARGCLSQSSNAGVLAEKI